MRVRRCRSACLLTLMTTWGERQAEKSGFSSENRTRGSHVAYLSPACQAIAYLLAFRDGPNNNVRRLSMSCVDHGPCRCPYRSNFVARRWQPEAYAALRQHESTTNNHPDISPTPRHSVTPQVPRTKRRAFDSSLSFIIALQAQP